LIRKIKAQDKTGNPQAPQDETTLSQDSPRHDVRAQQPPRNDNNEDGCLEFFENLTADLMDGMAAIRKRLDVIEHRLPASEESGNVPPAVGSAYIAQNSYVTPPNAVATPANAPLHAQLSEVHLLMLPLRLRA
jgi:hypothetical protein